MRVLLSAFLGTLLILDGFSIVLAEEQKVPVKDSAGQEVMVTSEVAELKKAEESFLSGVKFGTGIMANLLTGGKKPVTSARVVNGIVRVEEGGRAQVGVVAEFHSLWALCKTNKRPHLYHCDDNVAQFGIGPVIGLKLGSNNIIDAIFLGPLFAFRPNPTLANSFNIAVGGVLAPRVKVLGDGIEENNPLPAGETEVRFKNVNKFGYAILLSFAF